MKTTHLCRTNSLGWRVVMAVAAAVALSISNGPLVGVCVGLGLFISLAFGARQ